MGVREERVVKTAARCGGGDMMALSTLRSAFGLSTQSAGGRVLRDWESRCRVILLRPMRM